jgi:hypothetical protein
MCAARAGRPRRQAGAVSAPEPRPLPHSEECERAVLGAILMEPQRLGEIDLRPVDFYQERHQARLPAFAFALPRQPSAVPPAGLSRPTKEQAPKRQRLTQETQGDSGIPETSLPPGRRGSPQHSRGSMRRRPGGVSCVSCVN